MPHSVRVRLSVMMFLQYFVPGCVVPILSLYLMRHLGFGPGQVGVVFAMPAIGAFVAPYILSQVADRYISAERLVALCHALAGVFMVLLTFQTTYTGFLALYLCNSLAFLPTIGLTNAVALHHLPNARRDFGGVRMWGTAGWIAAGWVFGFLYLNAAAGEPAADRLPHALWASAIASWVMAAYALSLPKSGVTATGTASFVPWKVFRDFAHADLILLCVGGFIFNIANQFYFVASSPFLAHVGVPEGAIMPSLSLGQVMEMAALAFAGVLLARFGLKSVLLFAIAAQVGRCLLFATGSLPLIYFALTFQGFTFIFYMCAVVYVDQRAPREKRAAMQQLYSLIMMGLGNLAGALVTGRVGEFFRTPDGALDYAPFWLVPAAIAAIVFIVFLFFREHDTPDPENA